MVATDQARDLLTDFRAEQGGAQPPGMTVTRVRGTMSFQTAEPLAVSSALGWGLIVDRKNALETEIERPSAAPHADWMMWEFEVPNINRISAGANIYGFRVDVRSQRRLDEVGDTLWLVWEGQALGSLEVSWNLSVLLKLP